MHRLPTVENWNANCLWRGFTEGQGYVLGEQPGNDEDLAGKPFVGPAGKLLDKCLVEAGIDRDEVYVTNAVKHFKWEPSGKRRLHNETKFARDRGVPSMARSGTRGAQTGSCRSARRDSGPTLLGKDFRITQHRGEFIQSPLARFVMTTVHPSSILRAPDEAKRQEERALFIEELKKIAKAVHQLQARG